LKIKIVNEVIGRQILSQIKYIIFTFTKRYDWTEIRKVLKMSDRTRKTNKECF